MIYQHFRLLLSSRFLLALWSILFLSACQDDDTPGLSPIGEVTSPAQLTAALELLMEEAEAPGFVVSIAREEAIVYQQAFGFANQEQQMPMTSQSQFYMASVSKTFTAAAVVRAIEQGHFTLDTDINEVLPFELVNPKQPNATIRVRDLVTHTSGLVDQPIQYVTDNFYILAGENVGTNGGQVLEGVMGQRSPRTLTRFVNEYFRSGGSLYREEQFSDQTPGTNWSYSNTATGLVGYLIEVATGQSLASYVQEEVLNRLSMNSTTMDFANRDEANFVTPYFRSGVPFPLYWMDSYAEGGILSTSDDMSLYLLNMMQGASGASTNLFTAAQYDQLFGELLPAGTTPAQFAQNHGIFWYMTEDRLMHGGNLFGISTHLELAKDGSVGYVLLTNIDASTSNETQQAYVEFNKRATEAINKYIAAVSS